MTLQEFIEAYNRNIDWNKDILMSINPEIRENQYVKNIIDGYLSTEKINDKICDLNGHFEIFDYDDNRKELQIYSRVLNCITYYYVNPKIDEKTFKTEKINFLISKISGCKDTIDELILDFQNKRNMLMELGNDIFSSIEEKNEIK